MSWELEKGKAAEHLVCADLINHGHRAFLSDQGLPYDLIVDCLSHPTALRGHIRRVQVKSARAASWGRMRGDVYSFGLTHGRQRKRAEVPPYDVLALVAIPREGAPVVGYLYSQHFFKDGKLRSGLQFRLRTDTLPEGYTPRGVSPKYLDDYYFNMAEAIDGIPQLSR